MTALTTLVLLAACAAPPAAEQEVPGRDPDASTSGAGPQSPESPESPDAREASPDAAAPVAVRLPTLGLDEQLIELGIGDDGELQVPADPADVGWFAGGGRPGGPGPTVVVGHVDSTDGPAVFARLPELAPGDRAVVALGDGREVAYRVESVRDVPQSPFPTEEVFGATPGDVLRLITCTGPYDRDAGRYTENRVVEAVAISGS